MPKLITDKMLAEFEDNLVEQAKTGNEVASEWLVAFRTCPTKADKVQFIIDKLKEFKRMLEHAVTFWTLTEPHIRASLKRLANSLVAYWRDYEPDP